MPLIFLFLHFVGKGPGDRGIGLILYIGLGVEILPNLCYCFCPYVRQSTGNKSDESVNIY